MFHVGQKVVCVDDLFLHIRSNEIPHRPVRGHIYTVRVSGECSWVPSGRVAPSVLLEELVNPSVTLGVAFGEPSFLASRFRPLTECKTDISVFTRMLDGARTQELATQE